MNKRARARLIGVTAIVLLAIIAIIVGAGGKQGAYYKTVEGRRLGPGSRG